MYTWTYILQYFGLKLPILGNFDILRVNGDLI